MVKITSLQSRVLQFILQCIESTGTPPTLREIAHHFGWKAVGSAQDVLASLRKKGFLEPTHKGRARQTLPTQQAYELFETSQPMGGVSTNSALQGSATSSRRKRNAETATGIAQLNIQTLWDPPPSKSELFAASNNEDKLQFENNSVVVPLVGTVRAGNPQEAINQPDGYVTMPAHPRMKMKNGQIFYAVEVEGYSMVGAGLLPGDVLLIENLDQAKNGDLALVAVGPSQEVTLKRFALKGSQIYREALQRTSFAQASKEGWPPALLVPENQDFDPIPFGLEQSDRVLGLVRSLYRSEIH